MRFTEQPPPHFFVGIRRCEKKEPGHLYTPALPLFPLYTDSDEPKLLVSAPSNLPLPLFTSSPLCSVTRLAPYYKREPRGFASPSHDGFAFIAEITPGRGASCMRTLAQAWGSGQECPTRYPL